MGVGTLGRVAVSSIQHNKIVHSVITILRPNTNKILNGIFAYAMLSFEDVFTSMGTGSTGQTSLSNKYLGKTKTVLAPLLIQKKLNKTLENIQIKIDKNHLENIKLRNIRDLLLPKLMSGEIRVPIKE
jgi:type I restriction enzyme S subunit